MCQVTDRKDVMNKKGCHRRIRKRLSRRGSVTVFLMLALTALTVMTTSFIAAAREQAVKGSLQSLGPVWASSVLAEYDRNLFDRFGIFGYYGTEETVDSKLDSYARRTLGKKTYIDCGGCSSSLYEYPLTDSVRFVEQIRKAGAYGFAGDIVMDSGADYNFDYKDEDSRAIRNRSYISTLPSYERADSSPLSALGEQLKQIGSVRDLIEDGSNMLLIDKYIDSNFRNMLDDKGIENSYFFLQEEYVICGKMSDEENRRSVRDRIIAARTVMNMMYINMDEKMRGEVAALAEAIAPGPVALLLQQAMTAAWSLAESVNDYQLLKRGKPVPLMKDEASWAVDLESVIDDVVNGEEDGCIDTGNERGELYGDYLKIMLHIMPEQTKVLRTMDLIQTDMRYLYYGDFLLSDYYSGLSYVIEVNGREYRFEDAY